MAAGTINYPGPPVTGSYSVFDSVVDTRAVTWSCTVAGTPGTWVQMESDSATVVTVAANAGTVPVSASVANFTNSSAATMAITLAIAGAVDGQRLIVRVFDFSAVAQTIGWTNTENSTVSAPTTSAGSTTLPKTVEFQYNAATSKWRTILSV